MRSFRIRTCCRMHPLILYPQGSFGSIVFHPTVNQHPPASYLTDPLGHPHSCSHRMLPFRFPPKCRPLYLSFPSISFHNTRVQLSVFLSSPIRNPNPNPDYSEPRSFLTYLPLVSFVPSALRNLSRGSPRSSLRICLPAHGTTASFRAIRQR